MTRKRILCVDDEVSVLSSLKTLFRRDRERWDVQFAAGGREAMTHFETGSIDLIISDLRMPDLDGATLLEYVKLKSPRTIRVMLSGSADREDLRRASLCVDELLEKPCSTQQIRETLERLLIEPSFR